MGFRNAAIPEIEMPEFPLKARLIPAVLVGIMGRDRIGLYLREYIRLADKALYEYALARQAIEEQKTDTDSGQLRFLRFIDHFETCINALARLGKLLDGIKRTLRGDETLRPLRLKAEAAARGISSVRNKIEHMDEVIAGYRPGDDISVMLGVSEDGQSAFVGAQSIAFQQVALAIRAFLRFGAEALKLVRLRSPDE